MNLTGNWAARLKHLRQDLGAALVTFLLGLPLSLGAALASGAPPGAGLLAAAVAGLVCGTIAGAPIMVTGPVVALATLSHRVTATWGLSTLAWVVAAAGLIQLTFSALRLGRYALAVAPAILDGMLASVGLTLLTTQMLTIAGSGPRGRVWSNLGALPGALAAADPRDLAIALATVAVALAWERSRFKVVVPSMLVAILAACLGVHVLGAEGLRFIELPNQMAVNLPWASPLRQVSWAEGLQLAGISLELALVGGVYSLLSAASLDADTGQPPARLNRELCAQGLANLTSGLLGGLPVSGAVLRSTANLRAGAVSSHSMLLQGLLMLLALTQMHALLHLVPISAVAATFLYLGSRLVHPRQLRKHSRAGEALPFLASVLGGLAVNLFAGVVAGLIAAALTMIARMARLQVHVVPSSSLWRVQLVGIGCFFHVPNVVAQLRALPANAHVSLELGCSYTDESFRQALHSWCRVHSRGSGSAEVVDVCPTRSTLPNRAA